MPLEKRFIDVHFTYGNMFPLHNQYPCFFTVFINIQRIERFLFNILWDMPAYILFLLTDSKKMDKINLNNIQNTIQKWRLQYEKLVNSYC